MRGFKDHCKTPRRLHVCLKLLNFKLMFCVSAPSFPAGVEYQGRVSEHGGLVQVYPEIRADNGPICGFRIVNTDWGNIPFEVST